MKLLAARFANDNVSAAPLEQFDDVQSASVYWALETFGMERMEVIVKSRGSYNAYQRYDDHLGQRFAVYAQGMYRPISGWITEVEILPGNQIRYVVRGPGLRMADRRVLQAFLATEKIDAVIKKIVAGYLPWAAADLTGIAANGIDIGGWDVKRPEGSTPADAIAELCALSDGQYRLRDFWFVDEPFGGINLRRFKASYAPRNVDPGVNWIVNRADLRDLSFARSIEYMVTSVRVYYGLLTGTITGLTSTQLTDASATFITNSVKPGDIVTDNTVGGSASIIAVTGQATLTIGPWRAKKIGRATGGTTTTLIDTTTDFLDVGATVGDILYNLTDSSTGTITGITTTTTTNDTLEIAGAMSGGKANGNNERYEVRGNQAIGDAYSIKTIADTNYVEASTTAVLFWNRELAINEPSMSPDQALQYANSLLVDEPQQVQAFTVGSQSIQDANGARWPLWEVIARGGGTIKIADLYPDAATLTGTANRSSVFYITSLQYNNADNTLRVGVDRPDRRLDARLRRERIVGSAGIIG